MSYIHVLWIFPSLTPRWPHLPVHCIWNGWNISKKPMRITHLYLDNYIDLQLTKDFNQVRPGMGQVWIVLDRHDQVWDWHHKVWAVLCRYKAGKSRCERYQQVWPAIWAVMIDRVRGAYEQCWAGMTRYGTGMTLVWPGMTARYDQVWDRYEWYLTGMTAGVSSIGQVWGPGMTRYETGMTGYDQVWAGVIWYSQVWEVLNRYETGMTRYDQVWKRMTRNEHVGPGMRQVCNRYDQVWPGMGQVWAVLDRYDQVRSRFEQVWPGMRVVWPHVLGSIEQVWFRCGTSMRQVWPGMSRYEQYWTRYDAGKHRYDQVWDWCDHVWGRYEQYWTGMTRYEAAMCDTEQARPGQLWSGMRRVGQVWPGMTRHEQFWPGMRQVRAGMTRYETGMTLHHHVWGRYEQYWAVWPGMRQV